MTRLQISYHNGKLLAAYFDLEPRPIHSARSKQAEAGLVIDFAADGHPLGIEIVSPSQFTLEALNRVLASLNLPSAIAADFCSLLNPTNIS